MAGGSYPRSGGGTAKRHASDSAVGGVSRDFGSSQPSAHWGKVPEPLDSEIEVAQALFDLKGGA